MYSRLVSPAITAALIMVSLSALVAAEPIPAAVNKSESESDAWCCLSGCVWCFGKCEGVPCFTYPYISCCAEGRREEVESENGTVTKVYNLKGEKMEFFDMLEG